MYRRAPFGVLAAGFVALSLASGVLRAEKIQRSSGTWYVQPHELSRYLSDQDVTAMARDGTWFEGKVKSVNTTHLIVRVKKSSDPARFPRAEQQVPILELSALEAKLTNGVAGRAIATAGLAAFGAVCGMVAGAYTGESLPGFVLGGFGGGVAGAAGGYYLGKELDRKPVRLVLLQPTGAQP